MSTRRADTGALLSSCARCRRLRANPKTGPSFATVGRRPPKHQPVSVFHCPHVMSWADEGGGGYRQRTAERGLTKLYAQKEKVAALKNADSTTCGASLQTSTTSTTPRSNCPDNDACLLLQPYDSAYDAFIKLHMNVLSASSSRAGQGRGGQAAKAKA